RVDRCGSPGCSVIRPTWGSPLAWRCASARSSGCFPACSSSCVRRWWCRVPASGPLRPPRRNPDSPRPFSWHPAPQRIREVEPERQERRGMQLALTRCMAISSEPSGRPRHQDVYTPEWVGDDPDLTALYRGFRSRLALRADTIETLFVDQDLPRLVEEAHQL